MKGLFAAAALAVALPALADSTVRCRAVDAQGIPIAEANAQNRRSCHDQLATQVRQFQCLQPATQRVRWKEQIDRGGGRWTRGDKHTLHCAAATARRVPRR